MLSIPGSGSNALLGANATSRPRTQPPRFMMYWRSGGHDESGAAQGGLQARQRRAAVL